MPGKVKSLMAALSEDGIYTADWHAYNRRLAERLAEAWPASLVWMGTQRELGELVLDLYKDGKIKATSRMNAFEQVCAHFVDRRGKGLNPHSLWENTAQKRAKDKGEPR